MYYHNLEGVILSGLPYKTHDMIEFEKCAEICQKDEKCLGYTYGFKACYLFKEFNKGYGENSIGYKYYSGVKKMNFVN